MTRVAPDVEYEPTEPGEDPFPQVPAPDVPEEQQAQIQVHRLAFPLPDKRGITILNALIDAYLTLRSEGMFVNQLHSDLGGEFTGAYIEKWCKERCILTTTTPGVSPQTNGRAERAVQAMKTETKKILRGAQVGIEWWPIAVRYLNEVWKRNRTEAIGAIPPFMSKVLIRILAHKGHGTQQRRGSLPRPILAELWALGTSLRQHTNLDQGCHHQHRGASH